MVKIAKLIKKRQNLWDGSHPMMSSNNNTPLHSCWKIKQSKLFNPHVILRPKECYIQTWLRLFADVEFMIDSDTENVQVFLSKMTKRVISLNVMSDVK